MAPRGRPPLHVKPGVVISKMTDEEIKVSKKLKDEIPDISYDVLRVLRDGKQIVKVRKIESRKGVTDQSLVFQSVNGKVIIERMSEKELNDLGVKTKY